MYIQLLFVDHHSPDSRCIAEQSELSLRFVAGQKLVEISVLHVLCDHTERVAVDAHSEQANDVGVLQTGHDLYLFQEVIPTKTQKAGDLLHTEENQKYIHLIFD